MTNLKFLGAYVLGGLFVCSASLQAGLLDDLTAGNISATSVTVSFQSTNVTGDLVPTQALLEWGTGDVLKLRTNEQFANDARAGEAISGMRTLYIEGLKPETTYSWRLTAMTAEGESKTDGGHFTTLAVNAASKRGPDGTHIPPHTPAYATPATFVAATWEDVNTLLASCKGGEVVEVTEVSSVGKPVFRLTGGSSAWPVNVLIRPPLGGRAANQTRTVEINSPHITVAGFNLEDAYMYPVYGNHRGNTDGEGARRAFFWMCTLTRGGTALGNGSPDSGWYELVALRRGVGADRAQIKSYARVVPTNFTISGCWLEGRDRTNGKDHNDTLQTLATTADPIRGLRMIDTVFFRSANCSGQLTFLENTLIQNCWFGPVVVKSKVCGSFYATLGACKESIIRDSDWNGSFRQDAEPLEITGSRFDKLALPGKLSSGNTVGGEFTAQPPEPDLDLIWPR